MSNEQSQECLERQPQLAAYALGEPEPDATLHEHLSGCAICQQTMREYARVARVLPYAAPAIEPPPELRARILALAAGVTSASADQPRQAPQPVRQQRRRFAWPRLALVGALALALLGWNLSLQARLNEQIAAASASGARLQTIESILSAPDAQAYSLTGPNASGQVWVSAQRNQAYFVAEGLPDPGADKVYQMWLIQGETPVSAGTFEIHDGDVATVVTAPGPLTSFGAFGVTVEPRGGSATPSSQPILIGAFESRAPQSLRLSWLHLNPAAATVPILAPALA
jgi:anti-sigma-K factor RskA